MIPVIILRSLTIALAYLFIYFLSPIVSQTDIQRMPLLSERTSDFRCSSNEPWPRRRKLRGRRGPKWLQRKERCELPIPWKRPAMSFPARPAAVQVRAVNLYFVSCEQKLDINYQALISTIVNCFFMLRFVFCNSRFYWILLSPDWYESLRYDLLNRINICISQN